MERINENKRNKKNINIDIIRKVRCGISDEGKISAEEIFSKTPEFYRCNLIGGIMQKEILSQINVFPIADADTGDNLASTANAMIKHLNIRELLLTG
jgi:hypothetical protein